MFPAVLFFHLFYLQERYNVKVKGYCLVLYIILQLMPKALNSCICFSCSSTGLKSTCPSQKEEKCQSEALVCKTSSLLQNAEHDCQTHGQKY